MSTSRAYRTKYLAPLSRGITQQKTLRVLLSLFVMGQAANQLRRHYNAAMRAAGSLLAAFTLVTAYNPRATPEQRAEKKRTFDEMHIVWCAAHGDSDLCKRYRGRRRICDCARTTRSNTGRCTNYIAATMTLIGARRRSAGRTGPRIFATRGRRPRRARRTTRTRSRLRSAPTKTTRDDDDRPPEPPRYRRHRIHKGKESASRQGRRTQPASRRSGAPTSN